MNILEDEPLAAHSTFRIGGPARYFAKANTQQEISDLTQWSRSRFLPFLVIGNGSNCLFDDQGFNGLIILNKIHTFVIHPKGLFEVGGGYSFARLGALSASRGFTGLEFASGIPASVGGAIYMNAGACGQETADTLSTVTYLHESGEITQYEKNELLFSYRTSPFQQMQGAILKATFLLTPSNAAKQKQKQHLSKRKASQPYSQKSAGCSFRNPPHHYAGELIEKAGLKGVNVGGAQVSHIHGNFIVNKNKATSKDVKTLLAHVQKTVFEKYAVELEREVVYIPFDPSPKL